MTEGRASDSPRFAPYVACALTLAAFEWVFRASFTNASGEVAAAYAYALPHLYDGALWFRANGPFAVPWFTPSFCGGLPAYANPADAYFSLPQLLDLAVGPVAAIHATAIVFAGLGFLGFYRLVRDVFRGGAGAAAFAGGVFALNGFFLSRVIGGELAAHAFMLTPLVAWGALVVLPLEKRGGLLARDTCVAGVAIGYALHAGGFAMLPLLLVSVVAIALVHGAAAGGTGAHASEVFARFAGCFAVGLALAAGKVAAILAFLAHTTRVHAPLAGVASMRDLYALGVGPVPLVILALGALVGPCVLAVRVARGLPPGGAARIGRGLAWGLALAVLLAVPLALNLLDTHAVRIVRALPLVRSERDLLRYLSVLVPVVVLGSALVVDRLIERRVQWLVAAAALAFLVAGDRARDADVAFEVADGYSPAPIERAHAQLRENHFVPPIQSVGPVALNAVPAFPLGQTAAGVSTYPCYEPAFGYLLETFPKNGLHAGPVTDVTGRGFNLLDPSCFVFPEQNACAPGDRLSADEKDRFQRFRTHGPLTFARPWWQRVADALSFVTLATTLLVLLGWALSDGKKRPRAYLE